MKLVIGLSIFLSLTSALANQWETKGSSSTSLCADDYEGNVAQYWYDSSDDYYKRYEFRVSTMLDINQCSAILIQVLNDKAGCWKTDFPDRTQTTSLGTYNYYVLADTQNGDGSCPDSGSEYKSFDGESNEPSQSSDYYTETDSSYCSLCSQSQIFPDGTNVHTAIQLCYGEHCPAPEPVVGMLSDNEAAAGQTPYLYFYGSNFVDDSTLPYIKIIPSGGSCASVDGTSDALGTWAAGQLSYSSNAAATFQLAVPSWYAATTGNIVCVSTESEGTYSNLANGEDTIATTFSLGSCTGQANGCSHYFPAKISCTEDSHCVGVKPIGEAAGASDADTTCTSFAHEFTTDTHSCGELLAFVVYGGGFCSSTGAASFGSGITQGMCETNGATWNALDFTPGLALLVHGTKCGICTADLNTDTQSGATAYQVTSSDAGYGGYTASAPAPAPAPAPSGASFTVLADPGNYCKNWRTLKLPFTGTNSECQTILSTVVQNGGWCDPGGIDPRINENYPTQSDCDPAMTGHTWKPLTTYNDKYYAVIGNGGGTMYCGFCTNDQIDSGTTAGLIHYEVVGATPSPDFYVAADPETDPLPDAQWHTADVACGDGNFVTLGTNGDFIYKSCNGDSEKTGQECFLYEFTKERSAGEGAGVHHGRCCVNGHHKVCQQLLDSYKTKCTDDENDKGHDQNRECSA
tara:strand:+ start:5 stop:2071 length:2067 start_codon:yes stop_codon:yes gene_type:complete